MSQFFPLLRTVANYTSAVLVSLCLWSGGTDAQAVTEFFAGITGTELCCIAAGPDGNLWFTEGNHNNRVGRITPHGLVTEFDLPGAAGCCAQPNGIAAGPDGNLWFVQADQMSGADAIIWVTSFGALSGGHCICNYVLVYRITNGPDGNLWFTEKLGNRIGRITPQGVVTNFSSGMSANARPSEITAGPDGNLWFTEDVGRIGRITPAGVITEFSAGMSASASPSGIATGPDGNLWFAETGAGRIGRITPLGVVTEFNAGISSAPSGIAAGPDGNLWFTEVGDRIGRITTAGVVTEFNLPPLSHPTGITAGSDGAMWFTEFGGIEGRPGIGRITTGSVTAPPPANIPTLQGPALWLLGLLIPIVTFGLTRRRISASRCGRRR